MRDEKEERKKQARANRQTKQSNTAHPRQSLFLEKMSCLGWDSVSELSLPARETAERQISRWASDLYTVRIGPVHSDACDAKRSSSEILIENQLDLAL